MLQSELIKALSQRLNFRQSDVEDLIKEIGNIIIEQVNNRGSVTITGILTINTKKKLGRIQHNPKTGENYCSSDRFLVAIHKGSRLKKSIKEI